MQGNKFAVPFHFAGTLAANQVATFAFPFAVTLLSASAVAQNAAGSVVSVGTHADPDGYLTAQAVGQSGAPAIFDKDDWDGALLPANHVAGVDNVHIAAETAIEVALDFDGAAGTAGQNVTVVLYFVEG